ncbi:glycoside hydrolase family 105 protein [Auricularia subglabra TFB-10046 SS5]|nr:glycoside hydrolase family 105 protein [Auricularia subglabra TFB-10046 SS5]
MRSVLFSFALFACTALSQEFSDDAIAKVKARLETAAKQSWELGTRAQALLELDSPRFSVFAKSSIPPPKPKKDDATNIADVIQIATNAVDAIPHDDSPKPLVIGTNIAGGDPPSMGVAVLLASTTGAKEFSKETYTQAAQNQLDFVLHKIPQTPDGAISHRVEQVQLWDDFVYMVPPFLAYYGVLNKDEDLVRNAYKQCGLYRAYLRNGTTNLWAHMDLGEHPDKKYWSTGNAWAAAGMLRVLATMAHSNMASSFEKEMDDLEHWVSEILDGMYGVLGKTETLFNNYADQPNSFRDASSTALIAAATYRLSSLRSVHDHIEDAERLRQALVSHVDDDGWVAPVVNPESFRKEGQHSPEGQAFVLLLHAAHRDWVATGKDGGLSGAASALTPSLALITAFLLAMIL